MNFELPWMKLIRMRLKEYGLSPAHNTHLIVQFLKPILKFGEIQEDKLTKQIMHRVNSFSRRFR